MKLAKMKTKEAARVLVRITMPVRRITKDDEFIAMLKAMAAVNKSRTALDIVNVVLDAVPLLLENHYDDLVAVVATVTNKEAAQVEDETLEEMIADLKENLDDEYIRFFTSSMQRAMKESSES